jgi:hypothetical protein
MVHAYTSAVIGPNVGPQQSAHVHKYCGHTRMSDTTHCTYVQIRAVARQDVGPQRSAHVHKYYGHTRMSDMTHCTYVQIRAVVRPRCRTTAECTCAQVLWSHQNVRHDTLHICANKSCGPTRCRTIAECTCAQVLYYGHTRMSDTTHCTYVQIRAVVRPICRTTA